MKKKIQFMIPNAKHAFNIAHVLFALTWMPLTVALPRLPNEIEYEAPDETWEQFAFPMKRSS